MEAIQECYKQWIMLKDSDEYKKKKSQRNDKWTKLTVK